MRKYNVYTEVGDFVGIWARSRAHAVSIVFGLTLGRARNITAQEA